MIRDMKLKKDFFMDELLVQRNQLTYVWNHHGFIEILMKNLLIIASENKKVQQTPAAEGTANSSIGINSAKNQT